MRAERTQTSAPEEPRFSVVDLEACAPAQQVRPSIPPIAAFALALWACSAAIFSILPAFEASLHLLSGLAAAGLGLLCGLALILARKKPVLRIILIIFLGCALGCSCGFIRLATLGFQGERALQLGSGTYQFQVISDSQEGNYGNSSCIALAITDEGESLLVLVRYPEEEGVIRFGESFSARAQFLSYSEASRSYYLQQGVAAIASVESLERIDADIASEGLLSFVLGHLARFRSDLLACFDDFEGTGVAFLEAILFNDRSALDESGLYQDVKVLGLAHIIAVSGAHTQIVCTLVAVLLLRCRMPKRLVVVLQVLFLAVYIVCTGMPISGLRAAVMTLVSIFSVFARRRASSLAALSLCVCGIIAITPEAAISVSFILSFLATFGIVVFGGLARSWIFQLLGGRTPFIADELALTVSSGIFATPYAAAIFSQLSLISPLANVLAAPFFAFFCAGGLLITLACSLVPALFGWALVCLVTIAQVFTDTLSLLASLPMVAIPVSVDLVAALLFSWAIAVLLWLWWPLPSPKRVRRARPLIAATMLLSLVLVMLPFGGNSTQLIMLDVGQGDAILLRSEGATLLIDTGTQDTALLTELGECGIRSLDAILITHPDDDHCGSLSALDGLVSVGEVYVAADALDCSCSSCLSLCESVESFIGRAPTGLSVGDVIVVGAFKLTVLWPYAFQDEGGNEDSVILLLETDLNDDGMGEWSALLCGDAEADELSELVEEGVLGQVNIYKVGHHGSAAALSEEVTEVLSPQIAVIGVGENNSYGHPKEQTLALLEGVGAQVFRTDINGTIRCTFAEEGISVEVDSG